MFTHYRVKHLTCLIVMCFSAVVLGGANDEVELNVKAAYLLNFARFVEWPGPPAEKSEPLVIAVLGHDPIASALAATVKNKNIKGRSIKIKEFVSPEEIDHCEILFVPRSEAKRSRPALAKLADKPILTVGEASGFLDHGGIIEFQLVEETLRFSINARSADLSGLRISSELLGVAYFITGRQK